MFLERVPCHLLLFNVSPLEDKMIISFFIKKSGNLFGLIFSRQLLEFASFFGRELENNPDKFNGNRSFFNVYFIHKIYLLPAKKRCKGKEKINVSYFHFKRFHIPPIWKYLCFFIHYPTAFPNKLRQHIHPALPDAVAFDISAAFVAYSIFLQTLFR